MSDNGKYMLVREVKVLEYWRKRYMLQAVTVIVIAVILIICDIFYVQALLVQLFLLLCVLYVVYRMLREVRESLQTRGEGLVLAESEQLFGDVTFDYGGKGVIASQDLIMPEDYTIRECATILKGRKFTMEENLFYSVVSSHFLPITHTVFEGVILALNVDDEKIIDTKIFKDNAEKIKKILKAESFSVQNKKGKVLVLYKTTGRIFYQFSLVRANALSAFVRQITDICQLVDEIINRALP